MEHSSIKSLQKVMVDEVYPEVVRMLRMLGKKQFEMQGVQGFEPICVMNTGGMYIYQCGINDEEFNDYKWHILGNVLSNSNCPLYNKIISNKDWDILESYFKWCGDFINNAEWQLREKVKEITKVHDHALKFSTIKHRKIIFEKACL